MNDAFLTAEVLGVEVAVSTVESAADVVIERALAAQGGYAVCCNVHVLMTAGKNPEVMEAVREAWAVFPDGAPIAWMQRRAGHRAAQRVGGPDLMAAVLDRGRSHHLRHSLYGSTPGTVEQLKTELLARFPGVDLVKGIAPPLGAADDPPLLRSLRAAEPHIVWLALGAPKQEIWMKRHAASLLPALSIGVGAAFDFHAGVQPRAPEWMRRLGFEWAHRLANEPRRLAVRYASTNTQFLWAIAAQHAKRHRDRNLDSADSAK